MPAAASTPRQFQRRCDTVDRGLRRRAVERPLAAHEGGGIEIAEHDIGVGDGRGRAAIAVAGRARHRARAFRSDAQRAAGIDAGDRAAAGRDAGDIEAAQRDALAGEHAVGGERGLPVRDQRDVGARCRPCRTAPDRECRADRRSAGRPTCRRPGPTAPCPRQAARLPRPAPCRHATARRRGCP